VLKLSSDEDQEVRLMTLHSDPTSNATSNMRESDKSSFNMSVNSENQLDQKKEKLSKSVMDSVTESKEKDVELNNCGVFNNFIEVNYNVLAQQRNQSYH
jgi:hypothetical protein